MTLPCSARIAAYTTDGSSPFGAAYLRWCTVCAPEKTTVYEFAEALFPSSDSAELNGFGFDFMQGPILAYSEPNGSYFCTRVYEYDELDDLDALSKRLRYRSFPPPEQIAVELAKFINERYALLMERQKLSKL